MWSGRIEDYLIYEDKEIIVCHKPAGMAVQSARMGTMDMESALKNYLVSKPGEGSGNLSSNTSRNSYRPPYLGLINRLDQPVEGAVLFAKNQSAAKELTRQLTSGQIAKEYLAVTFHKPASSQGTLEDWVKKDGRTNTSAAVPQGTSGGKLARLSYELKQTAADAGENREKYLIHITLETGRHHQIRVQMAHAGMPLAGDRKYNQDEKTSLPLGLCSCRIEFRHPRTRKKMQFQVQPKGAVFRGFIL